MGEQEYPYFRATSCFGSRRCTSGRCLTFLKHNKVLLATLAAVAIGITLGFAIRPAKPSPDVIQWISVWGELFLRMVKMIILPMIVSSLIVGVASLEAKSSGKIGVATMLYIFPTTLVGATLGAVLAALIHPGVRLGGNSQPPQETANYGDLFADLLRNLFPENVIQACLQQIQTKEDISEIVVNGTQNVTLTEVKKTVAYRAGMNIIGLIVFSLAFGIAMSVAGKAARPLYEFFQGINIVVFKIMDAILWYSPFGIASLTAGAIVKITDVNAAVSAMGLFTLTVLLGCFIHHVILMPLIYLVSTRTNPFKANVHFLEATVAGMAPASSAVAMPYLMKACEEKLHMDGRIVKYVSPVCTTLNRDGSALYIMAAIIFVSQTYGAGLSAGSVSVAIILVTFLSAAIASVPSSSLVLLMIVSSAVNVDVVERMGLLMAVEWLLDRVRTTNNVMSNGYACALVNHFCKSALENQNRESPNHREVALITMEMQTNTTVATKDDKKCKSDETDTCPV